MRGSVTLSLIVIVSVLIVALKDINNNKIKNNEENTFEFSTFTSAVCESKENSVYCKDELFVNCNGNISKAIDVAECNGMKLESRKISGFAVFENDWEDPRITRID